MAKIIKNDLKLLSYIAEYRFLTVKQLSALTQRPLQVIRRRLRIFSKKKHCTDRGTGIWHKFWA